MVKEEADCCFSKNVDNIYRFMGDFSPDLVDWAMHGAYLKIPQQVSMRSHNEDRLASLFPTS